ncbi:MAG: phosphatase PAP2 family protein [Bacteriovoracia bacterium]
MNKLKVYKNTVLVFVLSLLVTLIDHPISQFFHESLRSLDALLQAVTWLGDGRVLVPLCIFLGVFQILRRKNYLFGLQGILGFLLSGAAVQSLKMVFGRPRPYAFGDMRYTPEQLASFHWFSLNKDFASFPSGHATAVFSVAWVLAAHTNNKKLKYFILFTAIAVCFTRVALAKHYLADTIAGAALGILCSQGIMDLFSRKSRRRHKS